MSAIKDGYEMLCRAIVREIAVNLQDHRLVDYILLDGVRVEYRELLRERLKTKKLSQRGRKILNLAFGLSGETVHTRPKIAESLETTVGSIGTQQSEALSKLRSEMLEFKEQRETRWLPLWQFLQKFFTLEDAPSQHNEDQTSNPDFKLFLEKLQQAIKDGWVFRHTAANAVGFLVSNKIETLEDIQKVADGEITFKSLGIAGRGAMKQSLDRIKKHREAGAE